MSNLKIEHYTDRTQEPYEQWLERKAQEYEYSHTALCAQRDALAKALGNTREFLQNYVNLSRFSEPQWGLWAERKIQMIDEVLDAVKEKP